MGQQVDPSDKKQGPRQQKQIPGELVGNTTKVTIKVGAQECTALLDTGSTISTVSEQFYNNYLKYCELVTLDDLLEVTGVGGEKLPYLGYIAVDVTVSFISLEPKSFLFLVVPDTEFSESVPVLLGTNVLKHLHNDCKNAHGTQFLQRAELPNPWQVAFKCLSLEDKLLRKTGGVVARVKNSSDKIVLPPNSTLTIQGQVDNCKYFKPATVLICKTELTALPDFIEIAPLILNFYGIHGQIIPVTLSNLSKTPFILESKSLLGELNLIIPEEVSSSMVTHAKNVDEDQVQSAEPPHTFLDEIDFSSSDLKPEQLDQLKHFLLEWSCVFSTGDTDVGHTNLVHHEIHLTNHHPFKQRHRHIPPSAYEELREHLYQLLDAGIIRRSHSPWASNVVLVRKKSGSLRMCVDYRQLNQRTIRDSYALPRIDDILNCLGGSKYFTVLDMKSGYHQIPIKEEHKPFTAFTVGSLGLFEFNRLPFGLCNSPATYQRFMEDVLGDLNYSICLAYLDDLIVFSNSFEEHLNRLHAIFSRISSAGLKFNPKKCNFFKSKINYVGHVVSSQGVQTDPQKIEKVKNWPQPNNIDELRQFLGFTGYYRRFIHNYAKIAKPLNDLLIGNLPTKKKKWNKSVTPNNTWKWLEPQNTAFIRLKESLIRPPVLGYPNYELPFEVSVDSSSEGIGGVIYQIQNGVKQVLAYASRGLSKSERNYPTHKLEFLALKWIVTEKFHDYLYGNKFTIYTDNNPLTYVLSTAKLDSTGHRWLQALSTYNFQIIYKSGKSNIDADSLSRLPFLENQRAKTETNCFFSTVFPKGDMVSQETSILNHDVVHAICLNHSIPFIECLALSAEITDTLDLEGIESLSSRDMRSAQCTDQLLSKMINFVKMGKKPNLKQLPSSPETQLLLNNFDRLVLENGVLCRKINFESENKLQIVLPSCFRQTALRGLHDDIGHHGRDRTLDLVRERFYWPRMSSEVENYVKQCDRCLRRKAPTNVRTPLVNIKTYQPLELVCMDYLSLETSKGGFNYILVITDHFTHYAQAIPTKSISAKTTAEAFFNSFVVHYGFPKRIHSDQGGSFEGEIVKHLCKLTGMEKSRTSPYHAMGNGSCERYNRTLLNMLGTLKPDQKSDWKAHIAPLVHAYNCTRHETTGFAPFLLMFGRVPRLPIDIVLGVNRDQHFKNHSVYIDSLRKRLKQAYDLASSQAEKAHFKQKRHYDLKCRAASLNIGDRVLVKITAYDGKHKIADKWEHDPYTVIDQPVSNIPVYVVKRENSKGPVRTLHRNLLLPIGSLPILHDVESDTINHNDHNNEDVTSDLEQSDGDQNEQHELEKEPVKIVITTSNDNENDQLSETHTTESEEQSSQDSKSTESLSEDNSESDSSNSDNGPKIVPVPAPRRSLRNKRPPEWHKHYVMNQNVTHSDWAERAEYLTQLALNDVFKNMPNYACDALVNIVSSCK